MDYLPELMEHSPRPAIPCTHGQLVNSVTDQQQMRQNWLAHFNTPL